MSSVTPKKDHFADQVSDSDPQNGKSFGKLQAKNDLRNRQIARAAGVPVEIVEHVRNSDIDKLNHQSGDRYTYNRRDLEKLQGYLVLEGKTTNETPANKEAQAVLETVLGTRPNDPPGGSKWDHFKHWGRRHVKLAGANAVGQLGAFGSYKVHGHGPKKGFESGRRLDTSNVIGDKLREIYDSTVPLTLVPKNSDVADARLYNRALENLLRHVPPSENETLKRYLETLETTEGGKAFKKPPSRQGYLAFVAREKRSPIPRSSESSSGTMEDAPLTLPTSDTRTTTRADWWTTPSSQPLTPIAAEGDLKPFVGEAKFSYKRDGENIRLAYQASGSGNVVEYIVSGRSVAGGRDDAAIAAQAAQLLAVANAAPNATQLQALSVTGDTCHATYGTPDSHPVPLTKSTQTISGSSLTVGKALALVLQARDLSSLGSTFTIHPASALGTNSPVGTEKVAPVSGDLGDQDIARVAEAYQFSFTTLRWKEHSKIPEGSAFSQGAKPFFVPASDINGGTNFDNKQAKGERVYFLNQGNYHWLSAVPLKDKDQVIGYWVTDVSGDKRSDCAINVLKEQGAIPKETSSTDLRREIAGAHANGPKVELDEAVKKQSKEVARTHRKRQKAEQKVDDENLQRGIQASLVKPGSVVTNDGDGSK